MALYKTSVIRSHDSAVPWRAVVPNRSANCFRYIICAIDMTAVPWRAVFPNRSVNSYRYIICQIDVTVVPWRAVLCSDYVCTPLQSKH